MIYLENDPKEDNESNANTSDSNQVQTQTVSNEDYWNIQENSRDYISKSDDLGESFRTKEQEL